MGETSLEKAFRIEQERDAAVRKIGLIRAELQCTRDDYAPKGPPLQVRLLLDNIEMILSAIG